MPWAAIPAAPEATGVADWAGRIVIDATNHFAAPPPPVRVVDLGDLTASEYVASLLPGARVVKAFNNLYVPHIAADPSHPEGRQIVLLAGDDPDAKRQVADLAGSFGFAPIDLGGLREGGRLIQLGGPLIPPRCQQADTGPVSQMTDTLAAVRHADGRAPLPRRGKSEAGLPQAKRDWFP